MRYLPLLILALWGLAAGCRSEPQPMGVEREPHEWRYPSGNVEVATSKPLEYEDLTRYITTMERAGWKFRGYEPAGEHLPAKYVATLVRERQ